MITIKLEIRASGTKSWFQNGKPHRDNDQPALIYADCAKFWYQNGKQHRDNDQPATIYADGEKHWYQNGKFLKKESK